jgi:hypothetical protein
MVGYIGSSNRRFFDIYDDQVEIIQRKLVEYIKTLQPSATDPPKLSRLDLLITTKNAYPWLPPLEDGIVQKKEELEKLIWTYLNNHYSESMFFDHS